MTDPTKSQLPGPASFGADRTTGSTLQTPVGAAQLLPRSALDFELTTRNATTGAQSARLTPHLDRDGDLLYSAVLYAQLQ